MSTFLERLEKEAKELKTRREKLVDFMSTDNFSQLPDQQKDLLWIQVSAMLTYYRCLEKRLKDLSNSSEKQG